MKILGKELTFNNNKVYHAGDKPTASEIGAASSSHTHNYAGSSSAGGNANAAVKLATARTINGTSFDGSANITTANWGTARNIQIGNTAKSVNGSANVTWTAAEIGVASINDSTTATDTVWSSNKTQVQINTSYNTMSQKVDALEESINRDFVSKNGSTVTGNLTIKGVIYGKNNIALDRGSLWIQALGSNANCDYLRFGTNIIASNDSKQAYLIDTAGSRATLDIGHLYATGIRLTNTGYPSLQFSSNVRMEYDEANDALYVAGTKSTSSGLREFRATQCNSTVNAIIAGKKVFVQSGTPSGVATGDVWIQI